MMVTSSAMIDGVGATGSVTGADGAADRISVAMEAADCPGLVGVDASAALGPGPVGEPGAGGASP